MEIEVHRTWLQLRTRDALRGASSPPSHARIDVIDPCPPALSRTLYETVGREWRWTDRLGWTDAEWAAWVDDPRTRLLLLTIDDAPGGYAELQRHDDGAVELAYFGLLPAARGQGLGGWLLHFAVDHAFAWGASRVWLHTCTLDAPQALPNYLARGFEVWREDRYTISVPDEGPTTGGVASPD